MQEAPKGAFLLPGGCGKENDLRITNLFLCTPHKGGGVLFYNLLYTIEV